MKNIDFKQQNKNIVPMVLNNKKKILEDLYNVEDSFVGRSDVFDISRKFIMEALQEVANSIELFELGYFDSAFYSLRTSVELLTTLTYFADIPESCREKTVNDWLGVDRFKMRGSIIKELQQKGHVYRDMKKNMPNFFNNVEGIIAKLHKYVHKQGFQYFYVEGKHSMSCESRVNMANDFELYLKKCIGIIAVMRLAIDPFPVLLMEDDVLYRCPDLLTEPYSAAFVDEYVGRETLYDYQKTEWYKELHCFFMKNEKKNSAVFDVVYNQYIDTQQKVKLYEQLNLMSIEDVLSTVIVCECHKIVKVYCIGGIHMYFTDRRTKRSETSWSTVHFDEFAAGDNPFNQKYGEAFMSVFNFDGENYFLEHNEMLTADDICKIKIHIGVIVNLIKQTPPA